jgi:DNA-binding FadR family transcriptional regulator
VLFSLSDRVFRRTATMLDNNGNVKTTLATSRPLGARTLRMHYRLIDDIGLAILRGEFQPGQPLPSEVRLCEKLGVSRTAMREAIRGIVAKGLVESRPKIGTRVRARENWNHLDPDVLRWQLEVADTEAYLRKMFQLRHATEPAAAAIAASAADDSDRERLREAFQKMIAAGSDNALWVEADLTFHKEIYLSTHNEFFWPIGQLFSFALREMFEIAALGSHRPRAIVEHGDLMTAIVDGKPDLAETAARTLLRNAATDIARIRAGGEK